MCGDSSFQMMCELWITSDVLDGALLPCSRLLARFPPLHMAASVQEVL